MSTHEENFKDLIKTEGSYQLLSDYKKSGIKVKVKHLECGTVYDVTPNKFQQGRRCPECAKAKRAESRIDKTGLSRLKRALGEDYTVLGKYHKVFEKILVRHDVCGNEYEVLPSNAIHHNHKCGKCSYSTAQAGRRLTLEEFKQRVNTLVGDEYSVLGEYKNSSTPILIKHNICGNEYKVTPSNFTHHNKRCAKCLFSRGEKRIEDFLNENNIAYEPQYKLEDCRNIHPLPFDFAVKTGDNLSCLIEFDGEFHFHKLFRTEEEFKKQKERDKIKTDYCTENDIPLIRIPYYFIDRTELILSTELKKVISEPSL